VFDESSIMTYARAVSDLAPDLAIIGAGMAGGALALAAARRGLRVLLLERSLVHEDRVRGEYMPPWGVQEAQQLRILDVFLAAGARYLTRSVPYGEDMAPAEAEARALLFDQMLPGIGGALSFGHPQVCTALDLAAQESGAVLLRGVTDIEFVPGAPPRLSFVHGGVRHRLRPRLIVGADGRGSAVARAIGAEVQRDVSHHLLCGMMVDRVAGWPEHQFTIGTEGDLAFYVFPQGGGRVRLYAGYANEQRGRFSGPGNAERFLAAFRLASLPHGEHLARARQAGPCHGYPAGDTWIDRPGAPGVVLVGDAAGHNCPTLGQGVSIALRDASQVLEAWQAEGGWTEPAFERYAHERRERMRRLRFSAQLFSELRVEFGPQARARRQRALRRIATDPKLARPFLAAQRGPHSVPAEAFTQEARDALFA
jgi:menaquinone-9 beta-reductase